MELLASQPGHVDQYASAAIAATVTPPAAADKGISADNIEAAAAAAPAAAGLSDGTDAAVVAESTDNAVEQAASVFDDSRIAAEAANMDSEHGGNDEAEADTSQESEAAEQAELEAFAESR